MNQNIRSQPLAPPSPDDAPKATILVVDDVPANLGVLYEYLDARGFQVLIAEDGESALEQASYARPDIILLDMMMPGIDGLETCRELKRMAETRDIPVIFMTALDDTDHKVAGFQAGAIDYISKPFQQEEVVARIATQMRASALERELRHHVAELSTSNADLEAFARTVAHDLKDPTGQIIALAEVLERQLTSMPEAAAKARLIGQVGAQMARIIDELLLLAQVRHGQIEAAAIDDMDRIVARALSRLARVIDQRGARIATPESWPRVLGHGPWLEEIWANLVSNAIKYGGSPPVIQLGAAPAEYGRVRFWVRDNGSGVPDEMRSALFEEFVQQPKHSSDGHGLGLAIVKRIMTKLGGELGYQRLDGERLSEFHFILPGPPE